MSKLAIQSKFLKNFHKDRGIHNKTMSHVHGYMQSESSLHDETELDESFFANAMKRVLRLWTQKISSGATVTHNKIFKEFNSDLIKYSKETIRIQPDFQIKTSNGDLLAIYELKSIFGNGTKKKDVLKDIARLAIFKKLYPKCKCMFVLPGLKREMISFFDECNFKFQDNLKRRLKSPYPWKDIHVDDLLIEEKSYLTVLNDLKIDFIQIRLSRTEPGKDYRTLSWEIHLPPQGYRPKSDFLKCKWEEVVSGDIISIGGLAPSKIQDCLQVDQVDILSSQAMFMTNDMDNMEWSEISPDDILWKYVPKKGRI